MPVRAPNEGYGVDNEAFPKWDRHVVGVCKNASENQSQKDADGYSKLNNRRSKCFVGT